MHAGVQATTFCSHSNCSAQFLLVRRDAVTLPAERNDGSLRDVDYSMALGLCEGKSRKHIPQGKWQKCQLSLFHIPPLPIFFFHTLKSTIGDKTVEKAQISVVTSSSAFDKSPFRSVCFIRFPGDEYWTGCTLSNSTRHKRIFSY